MKLQKHSIWPRPEGDPSKELNPDNDLNAIWNVGGGEEGEKQWERVSIPQIHSNLIIINSPERASLQRTLQKPKYSE